MAKTTYATRARTPAPVPASRWRAFTPVAFVLGFAAAFLISTATSGPDATEQRIAELRQEEVDRDIAQLGPLTDLAKGGRDRLAPVLAAMAEVIPAGSATPARQPTADQVKGWREVVSAEVERYAQAPSAGNGINVARTGLRTAVEQLAASVDGFEAALNSAEPQRNTLVALAGQQRTLGVRTWSVAAIQLDVININAGKGHVHVQLPAGPESGAAPADGG
ncbi:hypothetical protein [Actinokineospora sp. HUAS TT18]|uniref:hypothetical protein n=1 Tax=Actinokineospora sp. HUAS TT18 TaxID=3447451 RepID=UPI003F527913